MASVWGGDSPLVAWGQNAWESNTITASLTAPTPITASLGSLTIADMAIGLTGISSTGSLGSVTITLGQDVFLTGFSATASLGTISHEMAYDLTGISSTASLGTISHEMAYDLTGISSTASLGSFSFLAYTDIGISGNTAYSDVDVTGNTSYTDINHVA